MNFYWRYGGKGAERVGRVHGSGGANGFVYCGRTVTGHVPNNRSGSLNSTVTFLLAGRIRN